MKMFHKLLYKERYWSLKAKFNHYRFLIHRKIFVSKEKINKIKLRWNLGFKFWKSTINNIVKASLLVILFLYLDHLALHYIKDLPDWLKEIYSNLIIITVQDKIFTILSVIVSLGGLLLALFYPLLATVASSAYSKIRSDIRQLLLRERNSNFFVNQLAFLVSSALLILIATLFDVKVGLVILIFIALYTLRAIFSVVVMGFGIFNYFDPSLLMQAIVEDLKHFTTKASVNGFYWEDHNFQEAYRKEVNLLLEQSDTIVGLCASENYLQDTSFKNTINNLTHFLNIYLHIKPYIPTKSNWFTQIPDYKPLFVANMTRREMARKVNQFVQPDIKHDHYWVEESVINSFSKALNKLIVLKQWNQAIILFQDLSIIGRFLGQRANFHSSSLLMDKIGEIIRESFKGFASFKNKTTDELIYRVSIIDNYLVLIEESFIGFFNNVQSLNKVKLSGLLEKIKWSDNKDYYKAEFIDELIEYCERIHDDLVFEKSVEGKRVTPDWAVTQFVVMQYLFIVLKSIDKITSYPRNYIMSFIKTFEKEGAFIFSSLFALRGLHTIWIMQRNLDSTIPIIKSFDEIQKQKDTRWAKFDFEKYFDLMLQYTSYFKRVILKNMNKLSMIEWDKSLPNLFAESYVVVCGELNEILYKNQFNSFELYFEQFIDGAVNASSFIRQYSETQRFEEHYTNQLSNQTIMDLLDISGLALIYSKLYKDDRIWKVCQNQWDKFLDKKFENLEAEKKFIEFLLANYGYWQQELSTIQVGFERAHARQEKLNMKLEELGLLEDRYGLFESRRTNLQYDDKIFEIISEDYSIRDLHHNYAEYFIEFYLRCRLSSKNISDNLYKRELYDDHLRSLNEYP